MKKIIKELFIEISKNQDFIILEMECDKDHIHLLIESEPKVSILQIVRLLKSKSTIELWKIYSDELKNIFGLKICFGVEGILHVQSVMLVKILLEIILKIKDDSYAKQDLAFFSSGLYK